MDKNIEKKLSTTHLQQKLGWSFYKKASVRKAMEMGKNRIGCPKQTWNSNMEDILNMRKLW